MNSEAGQRTVANDDVVPTIIPESADYTFALQGFHISGNGSSNATYGNSFVTCDYAEDANCLGGSTMLDHWYYYTPVGLCGGWDTQGCVFIALMYPLTAHSDTPASTGTTSATRPSTSSALPTSSSPGTSLGSPSRG